MRFVNEASPFIWTSDCCTPELQAHVLALLAAIQSPSMQKTSVRAFLTMKKELAELDGTVAKLEKEVHAYFIEQQ